jgi:hypothetical protein
VTLVSAGFGLQLPVASPSLVAGAITYNETAVYTSLDLESEGSIEAENATFQRSICIIGH